MSVYNLNSLQKSVKKYRAKSVANFNWQDTDSVRLEISVGQAYHEGSKLQAIVVWAKENFKIVTVTLGDTLQRYNLMMKGISSEQAYAQSLREGDAWIERNADIIADLPLLRWGDIVEHADFADARRKVNYLYASNAIVQKEVDEAILEVATRRGIAFAKGTLFNRLSENYLLEEIAGMAIANQLYPGVSAYPGQLPGLWNIMHMLPQEHLPTGLNETRSIELKIYKK